MKTWLACLLLAAPSLTHAAAIRFNFTGIVTSADGIYADALPGATVVGVYTFDLDAAVAGQGTGTPGSYDDVWTVDSVGGSFYVGYPEPPAALVFSASGHVVGTSISYETGPINSYQNSARLQGYGNFEGGSSFFAWQASATDVRNSVWSALYLLDSTLLTYGPDGLPYPVSPPPSPTGSRYGYFLTEINDARSIMYFDIISMTPVQVPEPGSGWIALLGLDLWRRRSSRARLPPDDGSC
jgi:hypothetical protein